MQGVDWGHALNSGLVGAGIGLGIAIIFLLIRAVIILSTKAIKGQNMKSTDKKDG